MSKQFDSGHAKNVANLSVLNQIVTTFGAAYNPSNTAISKSGLKALHLNADAKLTAVNAALNQWKNDTNIREIAFDGLDKFSTQLLGVLQSTGAAQQTIDDLNSLVRKMRGDGKITKSDAGKSTPPANPNPPPTPDPGISNSQQSYDNKLEHFSKIVILLESEPLYTPNEVDYQVISLKNKLAAMMAANTNATNSNAQLKAARIDRNNFFYKADTGVLDIVKQVKAYVKGLFGASSQQYKEVSEVRFYRVVSAKNAI